MVINEETIKKIEDAWQYGAASTCQFAMREMDRFFAPLLAPLLRHQHPQAEKQNTKNQ